MKCLLDASYTLRGDKPAIRLFYKTREGSEIKEVTDFSPYFYATAKEDIAGLKKIIEKFDNVSGVEKQVRLDRGAEREVLRINVKQPRDVPSLRQEIKGLDGCEEVREADLPFAQRYIIDSGIIPMQHTKEIGLNVASFDMEVYNARGEPKAEKDPILMISYADNEGLRRVWSTKGKKLGLDYLVEVESEKEMIYKFIETVRERKIDIIVTYNGDNFDFPYLKDRCSFHNITPSLGLNNAKVKLERRGMNFGARVRGRPHVDMYPVCRQLFNLPRYRLEDVYFELFDQIKADIKAADMHRIWDSDDPVKLGEFIGYSMSDADATLRIALSLLPLQYELSRLIRLPVYECSRSASGQKVEHLLVGEAYKRNILVPNKPSERIFDERKTKSYVGAYVVDPIKGVHDNIILFDFRSLYPSIITSYNIDCSTIDCDCCSGERKKSPTGHYFCEKKDGFIPSVLGALVAKRVEVKNKLGEEKDPQKKSLLNVEQQALKLLANSMYGYFGFPRARWYSHECAEAIAALGRHYIHETIIKARASGFRVIYGDTDSVYLTLDELDLRDDIMRKAKNFLKEINNMLPGDMELEFEGFYPRGIFITKKRYALMDEHGMLSVKGLETRRRDWSEIVKDTQRRVLNTLLSDKDHKKAADIVKEVVAEIKEGAVPLEKLAINTQITRELGDYVQPGPHIIAAKKALRHGFDYKQGSIVTYIITRKGDSISDRARVIDLVEEGDYDADYYINNQLLPAVMRILEAFDYSEDELKGLGKQMTLDSFR
ncbi:MAG: DNA polymerase [Candidatus Altiarchaeales archaeon ex4484_96]|nr:MAG: DNA polymerase [Candidatus Altiarchaeales archaeon ex4484_96]